MTDPLVAVASITCDRKKDANYGIPHRLDYPNMVYNVNVETVPITKYHFIRPSTATVAEIEKDPHFAPFHEGPDGIKYYTTKEGNEPFNVIEQSTRQPWVQELESKVRAVYPLAYLDYWHVRSDWRPVPDPDTDQDQRRLIGIVTARNMARDFARHMGAEWLLFLDADVVVPPDSIQRLLEVANYTGRRLLGGIVPSREVGSRAKYIFKPDPVSTWMPNAVMRDMIATGYIPTRHDVFSNGVELLGVQHATCGFMMIHRDIYEPQGFSLYSRTADDYYTDPETGQKNVGLSEDPLYGIEYIKRTGEKWLLRLDLIAEHLGELGPQETGVSYLDGRP